MGYQRWQARIRIVLLLCTAGAATRLSCAVRPHLPCYNGFRWQLYNDFNRALNVVRIDLSNIYNVKRNKHPNTYLHRCIPRRIPPVFLVSCWSHQNECSFTYLRSSPDPHSCNGRSLYLGFHILCESPNPCSAADVALSMYTR